MTQSQPPPYARIVEEISRRIDAGELRPGERVPSTRRIIKEWGVAMATASKALTALQQQGLARAVPGVGTVVAERSARVAARAQLAADSRERQAAPAAAPAAAPSPATAARRPRRDDDAALTQSRVVLAGVAVADAEGMAAVSMRRIAGELGTTAMSLYRHVGGKDQLIDLMGDQVFTELVYPDPAPAGWRERMDAGARLLWGLSRRHTWLGSAISMTRPAPWPNAMTALDWSMQPLLPLVDPGTMMHMGATMMNLVRSLASDLELEAEAQQATGLTSEQYMDTLLQTVIERLATGRYPAYAEVMTIDLDMSQDTLFEFGLEGMLDGFAVRVAKAAATPGR